MAWEQIKRVSRGGNRVPKDWWSVPAVRFGKTSTVFNWPFLTAFGLKEGSAIGVFIDRANRKVGFKHLNGDEAAFGYTLLKRSYTSKHTAVAANISRDFSEEFPEAMGVSYRAELNSADRIIEVAISADRRLKE